MLVALADRLHVQLQLAGAVCVWPLPYDLLSNLYQQHSLEEWKGRCRPSQEREVSARNRNNIFWAEELKDVQHLAASNARSCREVKEAWNFLPPMRQLECAS